jgi:thymidylate synthase
VDVNEEFPILKSKSVKAKSAQEEIEWIWKKQSNNIHDLRPHIWDEWADENGSIGKAYAYQLNRPISIYTDPVHKKNFRAYKNQAEYIIEYLREFPNGRWGVATLWNPEELSGMNLVPCVHTSTWNLDGGRLNCLLDQRSGDFPLGVPFNTTQYAILMHMIARDLGVEPGNLTHVIADAHIYDRQMEGVEFQLSYYNILKALASRDRSYAEELAKNITQEKFPNQKILSVEEILAKAELALTTEPHFEIYSEKTGFFEYFANECKVEDYKNMGDITFGEVVV